MRQSRLIKRLESLDHRARDRFSKFVNSPYFNQHDKTIQLLNLIFIAFEKEKPALLTRERIFNKLFPKESFEEQRLQNVMSYLMRLYHRFLAYEKIEAQDFAEPLATLEEAYHSNQLDVFTNRSKLFERTLKDHPKPDDNYYYHTFRYYDLKRDYVVSHINSADQKSGQQLIHALDDFYIISKLRQACHLKAHEWIVNANYDFTFLKHIESHIAANEDRYKDAPTIIAYYTIVKMLDDIENPSHYSRLKELLLTYEEQYTPENLNELYNFASNYCITRVNKGDQKFQRELFDIYQQSVKNETVLVNGRIAGWDYKNIAALGCHLKEFNWTYHFIEDYKDRLIESHRVNAYYYSLAFYYACREDFDKASDLLLEVQFTEVQYYLGGNLLLIRCYYEMNNTEALISLLESLRIYVIRSKKMTTKEKKSYNSMIRFAKKIIYLKTERIALDKKDFERKVLKLEEDISSNDNIYAKSWLLEKCRSFLTSKSGQFSSASIR
ncbi:MAG: hypothetical protein AAF849_21155 [Bacteroidota bacterium]